MEYLGCFRIYGDNKQPYLCIKSAKRKQVILLGELGRGILFESSKLNQKYFGTFVFRGLQGYVKAHYNRPVRISGLRFDSRVSKDKIPLEFKSVSRKKPHSQWEVGS